MHQPTRGPLRALISRRGSGIVEGVERPLGPKVRAMGEERDAAAAFAHDGLELVLR
ncbi:MAG TPA: hypothetical protein VLT32_18410 [Candidatus Sulfomarinibacteraceae bacterium]|nr:hypothetical protein [Candidatus Sulfomarinibacteraceae bacterium]